MAKVDAFFASTAQPYLAKMDAILANSKFIHGDKLMMTDFWFSKLWTDFATNELHPHKERWMNAFAPYANLQRYGQDITAELSDYLEKRDKRYM